MAFSYSDKNYTVVGNLCFVHIKNTTVGNKTIAIPHAIADRMFLKKYWVSVVSASVDGNTSKSMSVYVSSNELSFNATLPIAYVNFSFPIDSNK